MAATIVTISNDVLLNAGSARVYTADTIAGTLIWVERPYLWCDSLVMVAGPQIDQAILRFDYGDFIARERTMFNGAAEAGVTVPVNFDNKYVKIEILSGDSDPQNDTVAEADILFTWYGVIEVDEREHATANELAAVVTGQQTLYALGLLRLLEREIIDKSWVEHEPDGDPMEIGRGIGFNRPDVGINEKFGNRSWQLATSGDGFIFSWYPSPEHDPDGVTETWDAAAALEYLMERHNPKDGADEKLGNWSVSTDALDWYEISVPTDRRSVKAVVDELVNRRRLVGYYVSAEENASSELDVTLNIFTFTDTAISLPNGGEIPANENLIILADTPTPRVRSLKLRRLTTQVYDTIRVEGRPPTSTFTADVGVSTGPIEEGWSSTLQTSYEDLAAEAEPEVRRGSDEFRDVFSRFPLNQSWDHKAVRTSDSAEYMVAIPVEDLPETIEDSEVDGLFAVADATPPNLWHMGKLLPRWLSLKDADTNELRRPFVLFQDSTDKYVYAEHLNYDGSRGFACHMQMLPESPGVRLIVNRAGQQHLIARSDYSEAGTNPVEFLDMLATISIEWDERVWVEIETEARTPSLGQTKLIQLQDARLDFELPGCVTDISDSMSLTESTGQVLRDDRPRMREIAEAASQWYGSTRQTLVMEYQESFPLVEVGQLITDVNVGADSQTVLTPVTSVALDFRRGAARFATSYTEADFS